MRFGSAASAVNPAIVGQSLTLNGKPHTVVGVAGPRFLPYEFYDVQAWAPPAPTRRRSPPRRVRWGTALRFLQEERSHDEGCNLLAGDVVTGTECGGAGAVGDPQRPHLLNVYVVGSPHRIRRRDIGKVRDWGQAEVIAVRRGCGAPERLVGNTLFIFARMRNTASRRVSPGRSGRTSPRRSVLAPHPLRVPAAGHHFDVAHQLCVGHASYTQCRIGSQERVHNRRARYPQIGERADCTADVALRGQARGIATGRAQKISDLFLVHLRFHDPVGRFGAGNKASGPK